MKICITEAVWESYQTRLFSVAPQAEVLRLSREGQFSGSADDVDAFFFSEDLYRAPRATVEAALGVATSGIRWGALVVGGDRPSNLSGGAGLGCDPGALAGAAFEADRGVRVWPYPEPGQEPPRSRGTPEGACMDADR